MRLLKIKKEPNEKYAVTRDFKATQGFLDQVRGVAQACIVCNRPSGYRDVDSNWSHAICADEGSEAKRQAKITAQGGKVAPDAGPVDLDVVTRMAERSSAGPRAELEKSPTERRGHYAPHPSQRPGQRPVVLPG
jgi:hypothetical protein